MEARPQATFFNVVQRTDEPRGPLARVSLPRGFAAEPALLLLAEPQGRATSEQVGVFLDMVLRTFQRTPGSITSRLISALQVARRQVLGWEEDADIHALCAVATAEGVYLASVGESHAYLLSAGSGRREARLLDFPEASEGSPGRGRVRLLRLEPAAGETLLMVTEAVVPHAEQTGLPTHVSSPPSSLVRQLWQQSWEESLAAAICFTFGPGRPLLTDLAREKRQVAPRGRFTTARPTARPPRGRRWSMPSWIGGQMASLPRPPWRQRLRPLFFLLLVAAILAGGAIAASRLPSFLEARAASQREQLVQQAQDALERAATAPTKNQRREQLVKALDVLNEAQTGAPLLEGADELRRQAEEALRVLDAKYELTGWQTILEAPQGSPPASRLRQLAFGGGQVYVLDQQRGTVYGYRATEDENKRLTPKLELAGPATPAAVSIRLVGWVDETGTGNQATALLIDQDRRLFALAADGALRPLAWRDTGELESLTSIASQEGRLYLLDGLAGQVWRYIPTDQGYDSERRSAAASRAMTDAVDLAIDQAIFVLTRSGSIYKFLAGKPQPFPQDGLDRPLEKPTALFCDITNGLLYVADTGNDRIVVFSLDGTFQRQYVAPELAGVRGVAVDASQAVLYALAGERLLFTRLPE